LASKGVCTSGCSIRCKTPRGHSLHGSNLSPSTWTARSNSLWGVECKAAYEPDLGTTSPLLNVLKKPIKVLCDNHSCNIFGGLGRSRNTGFAGRPGAVGSRRRIRFAVGKPSLFESELRFSGTDSQVSVRSDNSWIGPGRLLHGNPPTAKTDQGPKGT